jgi:hypothetical protein
VSCCRHQIHPDICSTLYIQRADEDEIEGRAVLAFSLAIGYHFIAADLGARDRNDAIELAARQLLA